MNTADRAKAITTAIECLHYTLGKLQGGATHYSMARRILDQQSTAVSMGASASGSGSGGMPTSKGTHSDPTCAAAMARLAGTNHDDESTEASAKGSTLARINELHAIIGDTAQQVTNDIMRALHDVEPPQQARTLTNALRHLERANTIPHTADRAAHTWRQCGRKEDAAQLDTSIDLLAKCCLELSTLVSLVLGGAARKVADKPKQKPRLSCIDCQRHGFTSDVVNVAQQRCAKCVRFWREYHVPPTAAICREWDYGRNRLTPGMIAEAKASAKTTKRKRTG